MDKDQEYFIDMDKDQEYFTDKDKDQEHVIAKRLLNSTGNVTGRVVHYMHCGFHYYIIIYIVLFLL